MSDLVTPSLTLTWEAAHTAVEAAVKRGLATGVKMNAAVADAGGNPIAFLRAPGAFLASAGIAQDKAASAAGFGIPTGTLWEAVKDDPSLVAGIATRPGVAAFGGGFPIVVDGQVVGGIGVSGGSVAEDEDCARAGLAALGLEP